MSHYTIIANFLVKPWQQDGGVLLYKLFTC